MSGHGFPEGLTLRRLYVRTADMLSEIGVAFPKREALLLCEHCLGIEGRTEILTRGDSVPDSAAVQKLYDCVEQRERRPLQYILGEWEFYGLSFAVGEGVLVPRDDTAALVDTVCGCAAEMSGTSRAGGETPPLSILDLCAGSGAVGLAVCQRLNRILPEVSVDITCAELSEEAMPYLEENVRRFGGGRVFIERADVLAAPDSRIFPDGHFDIVCSNPPYIRSGDIAGLSREVRQEPAAALDGGADGLAFYRAISSLWSRVLRRGGVMAFEIGAGTEREVSEIMAENGFGDIRGSFDLSRHIRTIYGTCK